MRILFSAPPDVGHTLPALPLAKAAQQAGHEVAYLTDESMSEFVSPVPVLPVGPPFGVVRAEAGQRILSQGLAKGPPPSPAGYNVTNGLTPEILAELFVRVRADLSGDEALARAHEFRPDVMVADDLDVLGPLAAAALDIPWAAHAFGLAPAAPYREALDAATAELLDRRGLTPTPRVAHIDLWPELLLQAEATAPVADRIDIRPEPYGRDGTTWSASGVPGREDRPRVLVTLGTTINDPAVLTSILSSIAQLDVNVIATVATQDQVDALDVDADRVQLVTFVPIDALLADTHLVVSAAGAGTVLAPLCRGIPAVLLPIVAEQPLNAERVAAAGAAVVVADPAAVGDAVRRVLADSSYRTAAQAVADQIEQMNTPQQALDMLLRRMRPSS